MTMLSETHQALLARAVQAADLAAERIMSHYGRDLAIESKGIGTYSGDVVTRADKEAQAIIFETLRQDEGDPLLADVAMLAEEMSDYSVSQRFEKSHTFIIDPLDGTRGFLDRTNSFAVSIALTARDGTPVFGVAVLPGFGKRYLGIHNQEASENGRRLAPPELTDELVLLVSEAEIFPPESNAAWHRICDAIKARTSVRKIRPHCLGSPVHKGCLTAAATTPTLYLGLPRADKGVSVWDLAAIAAITSGAGGWVSDMYGNPLELNRRDAIYCHHKGFLFCNHKAIAQAALKAFQP